MKISPRIENYIWNSVDAKFGPLYDEVYAKFHEADNEFAGIYNKTRCEVDNLAIDLYIERLGKFLSKEDVEELRKDQEINANSICSAYRGHRRYTTWHFMYVMNSPLRKANNKLNDASKKAKDDIYLALELGGTKDDLERMLNELNPTLESLGIE